MASHTICINHITKVEGHGSLNLRIKDGKVKVCEFQAIEGARFFEGLVVDRLYDEVHEITSRICGICSCAHSVASVKAIERALGIQETEQTHLIRTMLTIGERIRSHASHLFLFVLPDYLGYESAIAMAKKYKKEVDMALRLIKLGNDIVTCFGGRIMHQHINVPGGVTQIPSAEDCKQLAKRLESARKDADVTMDIFGKLNYPKFERKSDYFSLKQLDDFSLIDGTLIDIAGKEIPQKEYSKFLSEYITPYATSKFAVKEGKGYMVGALSRLNNDFDRLGAKAKKMAKKYGFCFPSFNPFHMNVAQTIEIVHWVERGVEILKTYEFKEEPLQQVKPKRGVGIAAVEAPRGLLFHEYHLDEKGKVEKCNIITPTCQNLRQVEDDIRAYIQFLLDKNANIAKDKLILEVEKLIRAYDPCFSCSTHFLKVNWV